MLQELRATIANAELGYEIGFWRSAKKEEVDFVLYGERGLIAIEVKRASRVREDELKGLREFLKDYPMARAYLLYGGSEHLKIGLLPMASAFRNWMDLLCPRAAGQ